MALEDHSLGQRYLNLGLRKIKICGSGRSFSGTEISKSGTQEDQNLWLREIILWEREDLWWLAVGWGSCDVTPLRSLSLTLPQGCHVTHATCYVI